MPVSKKEEHNLSRDPCDFLKTFLILFSHFGASIMEAGNKLFDSAASGFMAMVMSCYAVSDLNGRWAKDSSNYEPIPFESILTGSIVAGCIFSIITWLFLTLKECREEARYSEQSTFELFKEEVLTPRTIWTIAGLIVMVTLFTFLGFVFLGLALIFLYFLKGIKD